MIQKITYPCKIDSSMQPAMFYKARVKEPRPLLVALHTWSYDHSSAFEHYDDYCIKLEWNMIFPEKKLGCRIKEELANLHREGIFRPVEKK